MKKIIVILVLSALCLLGGLYATSHFFGKKDLLTVARNEVLRLKNNDEIKNGDIIFQTTLAGQGRAIKIVTKSDYTHCGIIYKEGEKYFVFEAVQPVKSTPLAEWIARGDNAHYVIKRLKNAGKVLNEETLLKMKNVGEQFAGKNYDLTFEWNDDRMYCSELVYKIYKRAACVEIGELQKLKDFNLNHKFVKPIVKQRYGKNIPWEETVISPASIFASDMLETVVTQ